MRQSSDPLPFTRDDPAFQLALEVTQMRIQNREEEALPDYFFATGLSLVGILEIILEKRSTFAQLGLPDDIFGTTLCILGTLLALRVRGQVAEARTAILQEAPQLFRKFTAMYARSDTHP